MMFVLPCKHPTSFYDAGCVNTTFEGPFCDRHQEVDYQWNMW